MKRTSTPAKGRRRGVFALAALVAPALLWAQVSLYEYSQSVEPYTDITAADGGYSLGVPTWWPPVYNQRSFVDPNVLEGVVSSYLNPAQGPGFPIGFSFPFNGDVFDRVGVSNSGWISFGKSSDGNQAVWSYAIDHPHGRPFVQYIGGPSVPYKRNRVAGWGNGSLYMQDMTPLDPPGPITSLRVATIGTAPNRVCVVQWKDFLIGYPPTSTRVNFQIRLNESDNSVDVRYGQMIYSGGEVQVGLGGRLPEDFNSRMTVYEEPAFLYDWNTTVAGVLNTDACNAAAAQVGQPNGSGVPPVVGLNFKWTPDVCPPPSWPLTIADLSFDYALAQWEATSAGEYEYFVSAANDVNGPEVTSGTTTDPEAYLFGLDPATTYYVFVRNICGGQPGVWSLATSFLTYGGGMVVCDGGVVTEDYCSQQFNVVYWLYSSADGSPLRIEFLSGFAGNAGNESLKIYDGAGPTGTPLQPQGDISGYSLNAASGSIYIVLTTDAGACEAQPWYLPLQWRVGCKNCVDPLVNFNLGQMDCDNQQYYVDVNVFAMGSSTTLSLDNNLGLPSTIVSTTGVHAVGPFPAGQSVMITAQNPDNVMCYSASPSVINEPCVIEDCGPTTYTYCYSDNEYRQWAYQGANGEEIGIRFLEGTLGLGDLGKVYNGLDIQNLTPVNMAAFGGLTNALFKSGTPSTDRALVMELIADNAMSCQDADPLYGNSQAWKWVVACYDGCTQPQATFASNCLSQSTFEVNVTVTEVGSTGSVTITNSAGVAPMTATAAGTYTVGPFPAAVPVTINVEGASVLCTWTSPALNPDCSGVGIEEQQAGQLMIRPNPSTGIFYLEMPNGMSSSAIVEVMDLTGRVVAQEALNGNNVTLHLEHLPNGLYTVVALANGQRFTSKISVQH